MLDTSRRFNSPLPVVVACTSRMILPFSKATHRAHPEERTGAEGSIALSAQNTGEDNVFETVAFISRPLKDVQAPISYRKNATKNGCSKNPALIVVIPKTVKLVPRSWCHLVERT